MSALTPRQLDDFRRDGFLVVRGLYGAAEMQELSERIDRFAARPPAAGRQMAYYEKSLLEPGKKILSRIEKFAEYEDGLRAFIFGAKMMDRVNALLGEPGVLFKEKVNFKLPGGGGFEAHQDIQPGWDAYAPYFLSVLVTVDESTLENGCLELAAGQHTRGMLGEKWKPLTGRSLEG
ncbi:MAG TPA: phytanoyl-CoA dioxygenase family protein, partial [Candidatus Eisenbacteria bacterium]|nr:phytanoyl-CoA dioxygenase family protein [Candidatus Eisenbacteria bacterium]